MSEAKPEIKFKSIKKKRTFRQRKRSADQQHEQDEEESSSQSQSQDDDFNTEALRETLELQKLRSRSHGISAVTLASGVKMTKVDELLTKEEDPFKVKTGGLLDLKKAKGARKRRRRWS